MTAEDSRKALVSRSRDGDREAFGRLCDGARTRLAAAIEPKLGADLRRGLDLEDVLQETFTRAFESLERFEWRGEDSFYQWLRGIANNLVLKAAERQKRQKLYEIRRETVEPADRPSSPSGAVRRDERFDRLESALDSLSDDHRQVIVLARIEGRQIQEIARLMGRSESAVKNLLLRALRELKKHFGHTESLRLPERSLLPRRDSRDR